MAAFLAAICWTKIVNKIDFEHVRHLVSKKVPPISKHVRSISALEIVTVELYREQLWTYLNMAMVHEYPLQIE